MVDPLLFGTFFVHAAALLGLLIYACRRLGIPRNDAPFVIAILLWADMVLTANALSLADKLGSLALYIPASFVILGGLLAFLKPFWKSVATAPLLPDSRVALTTIEHARTRKFLFWFLGGTLALFALISLVLGLSVYPDNADSIIYRLPRAFWYVSHGNFLHPFDAEDKRLVFYPLGGVALYIPFVLYRLPGTFHSLPSLLAWSTVVYTTYRFARALGGERLLALFAAWLVGLTPSILAQATSTNDEIIAAAALIVGMYMGLRWLNTGRRAYFLLAGAVVALSAGTKLHIVFLLPVIGLVLAIVAWRMVKNPNLARAVASAIGWKTGLATLASMLVLFTPFLFYNYASTGRFYFLNDFKDQVFNLAASLRGGFQNVLIYFSQMIFSPIADLNVWPNANARQHFNTTLNQLINPLIAPFIDPDPRYYHMGYRFVGITLPVSVRFVEFSLWSAFVWLLWPWQAVLAFKQKDSPLRSVLVLLALTPFLWLVLWSFATLYMEGTATYFTFYLIAAAPAAIVIFSPLRRPLLDELRWVTLAIVATTTLVVAHNLVMYSGFRALPDLVYSRTWPYDWVLTEPRIIDEIRSHDRIRILSTHEKMPYFAYMHWNPGATYYSPYPFKAETTPENLNDVFQVLPISGLNLYGFMPIKVPHKRTSGLTYLGSVRAIGHEAIFASGAGIEKRYPEESDYLVLRLDIMPLKKGAWGLVINGTVPGLNDSDRLTFEYLLLRKDTVLYRRQDEPTPALAIPINTNPQGEGLTLTTIVRDALSGKELTRVTYPVGADGSWLPERGDY